VIGKLASSSFLLSNLIVSAALQSIALVAYIERVTSKMLCGIENVLPMCFSCVTALKDKKRILIS
jgi:hypothetical protein